ncbi:ArsR/SmtB family transcription factor [Natronospora cellulosivora (SeqCode)]
MENIIEEISYVEEKTKILKALSHPIRMCIVMGLLKREGCNVSKMQKCLEIPQSTLSQHLIKLKDLKIIKGERDGLNINYYVVNEDAKNVIRTLFLA